MASEYTFGDSTVAGDRLAILADVFGPGSRAFVTDAVERRPRRLLDLGCGPGHTTAMLAEALAPGRVVAVDSSPAFVASARERLGPGADVRAADVTALPADLDGFDVAYARFLLTHLREPLAAVVHWTSRLAADGVLALEEVESLTASEPVQARYLELQRAMLAGGGHELDVGARLASATPVGWAIVRSEVVDFVPGDAAAASMFAPNVEALRERDAGDPAELDALQRDLARLAADEHAAATTRWQLRRMILRRS